MHDLNQIASQVSDIVYRAGQLALEMRSAQIVTLKGEDSLVTDADVAVEELLRSELKPLIPTSTFWGEELGRDAEGDGGLWLIDPIDGTSNYCFGGPYWGVSVALAVGPDLMIGAVSLPALEELYVASKGNGVTLNGRQLPPIPPGEVRPTELICYCDSVIEVLSPKEIPGKMRCPGAAVIGGCFVASQKFRGLISRNEQLYDIAACLLFGSELGGDVRYLDGTPLDIEPLKDGRLIERPYMIFPRDSRFAIRS